MAVRSLELEIGKAYDIMKYPRDDIINANYVGESVLDVNSSELYVFATDGSEKRFVLMDQHWTIEKDGILTYTPVSSFSVWVFNRSLVEEKCDDKTRNELTNMLKKLGVQL
jgi:hypothetical protein